MFPNAAAAAQAIALAANAEVVRVSSSEALALRSIQHLTDAPGVISAIRSRRDLYYLAAYARADIGVQLVEENVLCDSPPQFSDTLCWSLVGEQPGWWSGVFAETPAADAATLLDVAMKMLANAESVPVEAGLPEYFSGDSPWRKSG